MSHFEHHISGIERYGSYICVSISKGSHKCAKTVESAKTVADYIDICERFKDLTTKEKEKDRR